MKRALIIVLLAACGGGGKDGDSANPDAKEFLDAPVQIDAPSLPPQMGIGQPCTPGTTPQGDCPTGFECLNLNGGTGKWCSKTCTRGAGDMCNVGYTGPG